MANGIKLTIKNINNSKNKQELISGGAKKQVPCLKISTGNNNYKWLYESDDIIN